MSAEKFDVLEGKNINLIFQQKGLKGGIIRLRKSYVRKPNFFSGQHITVSIRVSSLIQSHMVVQ